MSIKINELISYICTKNTPYDRREQKYTIQGFDEYIRQGEPAQRERADSWRVAIGLQALGR